MYLFESKSVCRPTFRSIFDYLSSGDTPKELMHIAGDHKLLWKERRAGRDLPQVGAVRSTQSPGRGHGSDRRGFWSGFAGGIPACPPEHPAPRPRAQDAVGVPNRMP
jgi:hypothetical protein